MRRLLVVIISFIVMPHVMYASYALRDTTTATKSDSTATKSDSTAIKSDSTATRSKRGDTTIYRVKGVVVDAERFLTSGSEAMMPQTTLTADFMKRLAPVQVSDALQGVPGLFVRDYGGLGGLKTASIRSGSSAQTLVLIDGIRLTSAQNGQVDLGTIPVSFIGSIDVLRGGASALYGANALTGVVRLNMQLPSSTSAHASFAEGSFEEQRSHVDVGVVTDVARIGAAVELSTTRGSFPYTFNAFGNEERLNRENGDARNLNLFLCADFDELYVLALGRSSQRGVPGAVVQGNTSQTRARLDDEDGMIGLRHRLVLGSDWTLRSNASVRAFEQRYRDPDANLRGLGGLNELYMLRDGNASMTFMRSTAGVVQQYSIEGAYADLRGGGLQPDVGDFVARRSIHATASFEGHLDSVLGPGNEPLVGHNDEPLVGPSSGFRFGKGLSVQGALRVDAFSDAGTALSPLLALRWELQDERDSDSPSTTTEAWLGLKFSGTAIRTSWSFNFRPPSFNELYYLNYGTATLRPERAHTVSVGATTIISQMFAVDLDVFGMSTHDLILSVPVSPVITSAQNVGRTQNLGLEATVRASLLDNRLMGTWSYSLQDARDKTGRPFLDGTMLPYTPPEMIAVGLHWREENSWIGGAQWQYTSYRYSQPGGEPTSLLDPYHLVSAYIGAVGSVGKAGAEVRLSVQNIFDASYVVVRGYPMPGRMIWASITLNFTEI
ncbi:MAG: TonB-dependent receptor [bacterium]|nr:TonB-dependent receptor [bacterium]